MKRTLEYTIESNTPENSIKTFLKSKGFSSQNLIELKKHSGGILVNGQPAHVNQRLQPGNTLTVTIIEETSSEKIMPVALPLDIVYEDEDLLVVNKPAGMPMHPSMNNYDNTVANALAWYFQQKEETFVFRCVNRLDKDTSGLTIIAKHCISAGILAGMLSGNANNRILHASNQIHLEYLAIIRGSLTPPSGTIDAPIGRTPGSVIERQIDFETGERAITHYQLLAEANGHSLIGLHLETGRTHQIRVHMKHLGFPLIGDFLYNPDYEHISRHALHAYKLSFRHPITGMLLQFTAPLPPDMAQIISPPDAFHT